MNLTRLLPLAGVSALVVCLAHDATAQKPVYGEQCSAYAAPTGYPSDLAAIPASFVRLGISEKEARAIAKEFGHGPSRESYLRLLVRELGNQETFVPAFLIGRHEVTNKQYEAFVKAKWPKVRFPFDWWMSADIRKHREAFYAKAKKEGRLKGASFKPKAYWEQNFTDLKWELPKGKENFPVSYVSYHEAQAYCAWAGLRLPYETEWQLALQGPGKKPLRYLWGKKWDLKTCQNILKLRSLRDAKKRLIGNCPASRSAFGLDDMLAGVWEWTAQPFLALDGYDKELKSLQRYRKKRKKKDVTLPLWRADKRVVRGGSYNNQQQAGIVFRSNTRMPLSPGQTVEDLGFRVAKSLAPGLDTTALWYRRDFETDNLHDHLLDLPSTRDIRHGTGKRYEQAGIERWEMNGELIKSYHMVSIAPVKDVKFKTAKELERASIADSPDGKHGIKLAAVFTTEPFSVQQGLKREAALEADMYIVSFRNRGLPRELEIALHEGARVLKLNKGVRPTADGGKADPKKDAKKKDDKKKSKKKSKKKKQPQKKQSQKPWTEVVDRYGIPDEVTAKFSKSNPPKEMMIHPGKLRIPVNKRVLLYRKHNGDYVAWAEYMPGVHLRSVANKKGARFGFTRGDKLEYVGGPRSSLLSTKRFEFKIQMKLAEGESNRNWITPAVLAEVAKNGFQKKAPVNASPNGNGNGKK